MLSLLASEYADDDDDVPQPQRQQQPATVVPPPQASVRTQASSFVPAAGAASAVSTGAHTTNTTGASSQALTVVPPPAPAPTLPGINASIPLAATTKVVSSQSALAIIQTPESTLVPKTFAAHELSRASAAELAVVARETEATLAAALAKKTASQKAASVQKKEEPKVFEVGMTGQGVKRTVAVVEAARDPLDPRRAKIVKLPQAAVADAAPIIRSPTKSAAASAASAGAVGFPNGPLVVSSGAKLQIAGGGAGALTASSSSVETLKVPSCVRGWSNSKGYIIPIAEREAADGRNHVKVVMSDRHMELAQALRDADKQAALEMEIKRQAEKERAEAQQRAAEKEIEQRALKALQEKRDAERLARGGGSGAASGLPVRISREEYAAKRQEDIERRDREKDALRKIRRGEATAKRLGINVADLDDDDDLRDELAEMGSVIDLDDARFVEPVRGRDHKDNDLYDAPLQAKARAGGSILSSVGLGSLSSSSAAPAAKHDFDISDLL